MKKTFWSHSKGAQNAKQTFKTHNAHMATATTSSTASSTLMAIVDTPNPMAGAPPAAAFAATAPTDPLQPNRVNMRDLTAITIDPQASWEPSIFKNMLIGLYIPIKYSVTTNTKFKERKSLPIQSDSPLWMNLPISAEQKQKEGEEKSGPRYQDPTATFSVREDQNKAFLDDMAYFDSKVQEFVTANMELLKKRRETARIDHAKGKAMKLEVDTKPLTCVPLIKTTHMMDGKTYLNFNDVRISDDKYKADYCKRNNIPLDEKKAKEADAAKHVSMVIFGPEAYQDGVFKLKRDPTTNKLLPNQGVKMSLDQMIDQKVSKVYAIPTVGFSKLFWFFKENTIRTRCYLNSCLFVNRNQNKRQRDIGFAGEQLTEADLEMLPPEPKRNRPDDGTGAPTFVIQPNAYVASSASTSTSVPPPIDVPVPSGLAVPVSSGVSVDVPATMDLTN